MKRFLTLICITLIFSSCVKETAQFIYDENYDQPSVFGIIPPGWTIGTWMTQDQNVTVKGFKFESTDLKIIYANRTESLVSNIKANSTMRVEDFYHEWTTRYYKIFQKKEGGGDKLWYEFKKKSDTELIWAKYPSLRYNKK